MYMNWNLMKNIIWKILGQRSVRDCIWYQHHVCWMPTTTLRDGLLEYICNQGSFSICAQPMRDDVTLYCCLSLAGHICKMIPVELILIVLNHNILNVLMKQVCEWTGGQATLTHWGRVMHICFSKLTIIGSDNGLAPTRCQAIIWTNDGILFIGPFGTNFNEILIKIYTFSFKKMHLKKAIWKMANILPQPQCVNMVRHHDENWWLYFWAGIGVLFSCENNLYKYICDICVYTFSSYVIFI